MLYVYQEKICEGDVLPYDYEYPERVQRQCLLRICKLMQDHPELIEKESQRYK